MRNKDLKHYLKNETACQEAIDWIAERDLETAWSECPRGDWMLWLAKRAGVDIRMMKAAKAECAALAWEWMPEDARVAVEVARAFARGETTQEEMQKAAAAAYNAAYVASCAVVACAAYAAAYAAYPAYAAKSAAYAAEAAAEAAAYDDEAAAAARKDAQKRCTEIVREIIPFTEIQKLVK